MKLLFEWSLPIYTVSEANNSDHWTKKKKRKDIQKRWIWVTFQKEKPKIPIPCHIKLTRVASEKLDDDNLPVSMKYIRDALADQIFPGLPPGRADDKKLGLTWEYDQDIVGRSLSVLIQFFSLD